MISKENIVSSSFVVIALSVLYLSHPLSGNKFCKQKNIEISAWEHDAAIDADAIRRGEGGGDRQDDSTKGDSLKFLWCTFLFGQRPWRGRCPVEQGAKFRTSVRPSPPPESGIQALSLGSRP